MCIILSSPKDFTIFTGRSPDLELKPTFCPSHYTQTVQQWSADFVIPYSRVSCCGLTPHSLFIHVHGTSISIILSSYSAYVKSFSIAHLFPISEFLHRLSSPRNLRMAVSENRPASRVKQWSSLSHPPEKICLYTRLPMPRPGY